MQLTRLLVLISGLTHGWYGSQRYSESIQTIRR